MYHIHTSWTTVRFNKQPVCVIVKKKTLENSLNNRALLQSAIQPAQIMILSYWFSILSASGHWLTGDRIYEGFYKKTHSRFAGPKKR